MVALSVLVAALEGGSGGSQQQSTGREEGTTAVRAISE